MSPNAQRWPSSSASESFCACSRSWSLSSWISISVLRLSPAPTIVGACRPLPVTLHSLVSSSTMSCHVLLSNTFEALDVLVPFPTDSRRVSCDFVLAALAVGIGPRHASLSHDFTHRLHLVSALSSGLCFSEKLMNVGQGCSPDSDAVCPPVPASRQAGEFCRYHLICLFLGECWPVLLPLPISFGL